MAGDDHVEVGSSLRSAAAFGFHEVLLEDRGAGWFGGPPAVRREARAAARRHKNPLRVHRATLDIAARYAEIVLVIPSGPGSPLQRENLTRGSRQLVIVGTSPREIDAGATTRARIATLGLEPATSAPLRLIASIILAEIARQVGRRHPTPGPVPRGPRYEKALMPMPAGEVLLVELSDLLAF